MSLQYKNYDKFPKIKIDGFDNAVTDGWTQITEKLKRHVCGRTIFTVDMYAGVDEKSVLEGLKGLNPVLIISAEDCMLPSKTCDEMLEDFLGEDRVFGFMCRKPLKWLFDDKKLEKARSLVARTDGVILIYGVGASLIERGDVHIFADMARWEIQNRYKAGMPNYHTHNESAPFLTKYKRGFFAEWRMLDQHKKERLSGIDYLLDTNSGAKLVGGDAFRAGLVQAARKPFRLVPYFDPGVWGGQWMKEVCDLDKSKVNFAWAFDGVPEENSVYLNYGDNFIEIPATDIVFYMPEQLLGSRVHARFGDEFPIRFDFLDTMKGGNLSLQVHPLTEYIQRNFGMNYTQDESYYILDCGEDCYVYLGVKDEVDPDELYKALSDSQTTNAFDADKFANRVRIKKHDHILIPAGTMHCSAANTMVLEISSTPYIFTFKLWDWGRVGLDGIPRPTHIDHGIRNIQFNRTPQWVSDNLVNRVKVMYETENVKAEETGLHEREFIQTIRYTTDKSVEIDCSGSVNMLNLVSGSRAQVCSVDGGFEPYTVHYAETFIVPASVGKYTVNSIDGESISVIQAKVR